MIGYLGLLAASLLPVIPCENLKTLALPNATITVAEAIASGPLSSQPEATPPPPGVRDRYCAGERRPRVLPERTAPRLGGPMSRRGRH